MFGDADAELVFHVAAEVGGIGANRANPGRYWFANLAMGANVLEQARLHETPKLVIVGTVCAYPKFASAPVQRGRALAGLSGGDERALRSREEGAARRRAGLSRAVRPQRDLPAAGQPLRASRQLPPRRSARRSQTLIRKMLDSSDEVVLWGDGSPTREFLYVDDCVDGLVPAAERYDGADPVNLGAAREISIRELAELIADVAGFEGAITWDTTKPNGQPRRSVDGTRARELFGFEARTPLREGIERTVAWYRAAVAGVGSH